MKIYIRSVTLWANQSVAQLEREVRWGVTIGEFFYWTLSIHVDRKSFSVQDIFAQSC